MSGPADTADADTADADADHTADAEDAVDADADIVTPSSTQGVREDIKTKIFQFRHCPNYPKKNPPHPPIRATLPTFSGRQKRRFTLMAKKY